MQPGNSLSERLRNQDAEAYTQLVRKYENTLFRVAARVTGTIEDAEEVRQQVLLGVWQKPDAVPDDEHLKSWIHRCAINASIDVLRRRQRAGQASLIGDIEQVDPTLGAVDDRDLLASVLGHLEPDQRALLSLRFDAQLTVREIGATLEKPHTTVQSQLNRALTKLRSLLNEHAAGEHP